MKGFIVQSEYVNIDNITYVQLFGRLENGESFVSVHKFEPYFFVLKSDQKKVKKLLKDVKMVEVKEKTFSGEEVLKLFFDNQTDLNNSRHSLHEEEILTFEADLKPPYRFLIDKKIKGSLEIEGDYESSEKVERVYQEAEIKPVDFKPDLKVASVDIEIGSDGKLYCIGIVSKDYEKNFIVSKEKLKRSVSCKDEEDCLQKFRDEIIELDPDVITGWNVVDFDFDYLKKRFEENKINFDLGRTNEKVKIRIESNFFKSSSMQVPGRVVLDGLNLIKDPYIKESPTIKEKKFDSYKLEDVASEMLGKGKLLKGKGRHIQIEGYYEKDQQKLVDYNLKDCELVYEIIENAKLIDLAVERSQLTGMPIDRITASIASFDFVYISKSRELGLVSPTSNFVNKEERIKGGFVMSPEPGIYDDVLVLDFKSLYPSIIRTFNIDPSSFLLKKETGCIESPNGAYFRNVNGLLPEIIEELHLARETAKKEKREFSSYAIKIIMNSFFGVLASPNCRYFNMDMANAITNFGQAIIKLTKQKIEEKGYKVIYGDSVVKDTRILILDNNKGVLTKDISELFEKCDEISAEGKEYFFPKSLKALTINKFGESSFEKVKYVMKHKTNKKIFRVWFTNKQYIDVTEDHSLIGYLNNSKNFNLGILERLKEVKPQEIGDKIKSIISLKKIPRNKISSRDYPEEVYKFFGYFLGNGNFCRNSYANMKDKDYYLGVSAGLDSKEFIEGILEPLKKKSLVKNYFLSKSRKGDIKVTGKLVSLVSKEMRDENGKKKIPTFLFSENEKNLSYFLSGLFSADGTVFLRDKKLSVCLTSISEKIIEEISFLLNLLGISNSFFEENKLNRYSGKNLGTFSKHLVVKDSFLFKNSIGFIFRRKQERLKNLRGLKSKKEFDNLDFDLSRVLKVEEIKYSDYVYDLEIEGVHRFFANSVLVHNTDSVFVYGGEENSEKIGEEIQKYINDFYEEYVRKSYNRKSYLELEFEKRYLSLLMPKTRGSSAGAKKRYAGLIKKNGKEVLEITGLEAIRGDWTEAAQDFQKDLLLKIFHKEDPKAFVKRFVEDLLKGKVDDKLIYRKSIRKELEEYTKMTPPHVKAARKMVALEGNRIEYYLTTDGPEPISNLKHKIDYEHYVEKQIKPIAQSILDLLSLRFEEIISGESQQTLF